MNAKLLFVQALTPLHPGTGQGVGVIDLPVAREVATGLPYLPGSSLKGVLRDRASGSSNATRIFGPPTSNADEYAGAALFTDQRLLLLPVRSLAGTFAWVTSPFILQRLQRDGEQMGDDSLPTAVPTISSAHRGTALVATDSALKILDKVILEDLDLTAVTTNSNMTPWINWLKRKLYPGDTAWQQTFVERLCIVHDDVLGFLLETATEIIARNQLDENKTSANLWYEEALPAETVLSGIVLAQQVGSNGLTPEAVLSEVSGFVQGPLQLGGSASIGRGLCRLVMVS